MVFAPVSSIEGDVGEAIVGGFDCPAAESKLKTTDIPAASVRIRLRENTAECVMAFPL
jgi:hypothetical protein